MYTEEEAGAVRDKIGQLRQVKDNILTRGQLADRITERRISWLKDNWDEMMEKYGHLPPEEQAYNIIFLEHMGIDPEYSIVTRVSPNKIKIRSYNFCPYLDACITLGLDTRDICSSVGELSMHAMVERINPRLKFERDYDFIRPHNGEEFCEEYIEFVRE